MKLAIILGTRPEIIKMSPIIRECNKRKLESYIIHTNQHYSEAMDKIFFEELELPLPKYNLNIGSGTPGEQIGKMLTEIEKVLIKEKPEIVLVQGDTNTVLAGALIASKLGIKVGHIESGLRSYDRTMPEEINRVLTDHISDYLFAPTKESIKNLLKEGIALKKIILTGNTIVDAVFQNLKISKKKESILTELSLKGKDYILTTIHRPSNVDEKIKLANILESLDKITKNLRVPIIFPVHPRTEKMIKEFGLVIPKGIRAIKPVGFLEFLQLETHAKVILTDSGGVQEEACILGVPSVVLRENTERVEALKEGASILAGNDPEKILSFTEKMLNNQKKWKNPFGDGKSAEKIILSLIRNF